MTNPVFIKTPKTNTEDLEDEERCNSVFTKEFGEAGDGDVESIFAVVALGEVDLVTGF